MTKHILIDSGFGLIRTAISQGGKLLDYYEESPDQGRSKGNIYKGLVKKVDPHIQAAFVRYGGGRDGFLPLRDVPFRTEGKSESGSRKKAGTAVGPGDSVVVQVVKDEVGAKGAALTTKLSLSGRYLVYMPDKDGEGGVSSRLSDEERAAMKKALADLQVPDGASVILRTAALNKPTEELQADLDRLLEAHREIEEQAYDRKEPGLLFREAPPAFRYLREYYTNEVERIWVNSEEVLEQCRQFFNLYEPRSAAKVSLSKDGPLMFQKLGLEAEVERLSSRKVALPSGANFVIDQTEALVAIDVNSAKSKAEGAGRAKDLEDTVFAINMEAGAEIARQLRLRDLGGIIVVDFIDMDEDRHRRKLEEAMRRALSEDKAKIKVFDISPLGLMQISRQRLRKAGPHFSRAACESCHGRGWHASPAAAAFTVLRRIEEKAQGKSARNLSVTVPFPVANFLLNDFRSHVLDLELRHECAIRIHADASYSGEAVFTAAPAEAAAERPAGVERKSEGRKAEGRRGEGRPAVKAAEAAPVAREAAKAEGARGRQEPKRRGRGKPEPMPVQVEWLEPVAAVPEAPALELDLLPPPPMEEPLEAVLEGVSWAGEAPLEEAPALEFPLPTEEPAPTEAELEAVEALARPQGQGSRRGRGRGGRDRRGGREGGGGRDGREGQPVRGGREGQPVRGGREGQPVRGGREGREAQPVRGGREAREAQAGPVGREGRGDRGPRGGREPRRDVAAPADGKPVAIQAGPSGRAPATAGNRGDAGRPNAPADRGGRKNRPSGGRPLEGGAAEGGVARSAGRPEGPGHQGRAPAQPQPESQVRKPSVPAEVQAAAAGAAVVKKPGRRSRHGRRRGGGKPGGAPASA